MLGYPGVGLGRECCDQLVMSAVGSEVESDMRATYHLCRANMSSRQVFCPAHHNPWPYSMILKATLWGQ